MKFCGCARPVYRQDYDNRDGEAVRLVCIYCGTDRWLMPEPKPIPEPESGWRGGETIVVDDQLAREIVRCYRAGASGPALSQEYGLSLYIIRRTIKQSFAE